MLSNGWWDRWHISAPGGAAYTYYVSSSTGTPAGSGGTGTLNNPWRDLADVSSVVLTAGQSVGFRRGDTWTAQRLTVGQSGSSASARIRFGAYGVGAKPIFDGNLTQNDIVTATDRTFLRFEDLEVSRHQNLAGCHGMAFGSTSTDNLHDIELVRITTNDGVGGATTGDEAIYCARNVALYAEDLTCTGADNHIAFHPSGRLLSTLTVVGGTFTGSTNSSMGTGTTGGVTATITGATWTDCLRAGSWTLASDVVKIRRCNFVALNSTRPCALDGTAITVIYSLINVTASATANTQFISISSGAVTFKNCTFLGDAGAGSQRGALYANTGSGVVTLINCAFDRWWRLGIVSTGTVNSTHCYIDTIGAGAENLDTETSNLTEANFADGVNAVTGRPSATLIANPGTDASLIADDLFDLSGAAINDPTQPTRGCYENAA